MAPSGLPAKGAFLMVATSVPLCSSSAHNPQNQRLHYQRPTEAGIGRPSESGPGGPRKNVASLKKNERVPTVAQCVKDLTLSLCDPSLTQWVKDLALP